MLNRPDLAAPPHLSYVPAPRESSQAAQHQRHMQQPAASYPHPYPQQQLAAPRPHPQPKQQAQPQRPHRATDSQTSADMQRGYVTERRNCWNEVSRLCVGVQSCVLEESPEVTMSRERYFRVYEMCVSLLRAVECLDPERSQRRVQYLAFLQKNEPYFARAELQHQEADYAAADSYSVYEPSNREEVPRRGSHSGEYRTDSTYIPGYSSNNPVPPGVLSSKPRDREPHPYPPYDPHNAPPSFVHPDSYHYINSPGGHTAQPGQSKQLGTKADEAGESQNSSSPSTKALLDRTTRPNRKRKQYPTHRGLKCRSCHVTETPEWRRGPDGDHTLCNACGLHWAKEAKKTEPDLGESSEESVEPQKKKKKHIKNRRNNEEHESHDLTSHSRELSPQYADQQQLQHQHLHQYQHQHQQHQHQHQHSPHNYHRGIPD